MYKEILLKPIYDGYDNRPTKALSQLPSFVTDAIDSGYEIMVGQDTWSSRGRETLVDYELWLDIDAVNKEDHSALENLEATLPLCRAICQLLQDNYGLSPEQIELYFSGHSGFHLYLPFLLSGKTLPESLHTSARTFCLTLEAAAPPEARSTALLDRGLYTPRHVIRAPWSRHRRGLRKVPLTIADLSLTAPVLHNRIEKLSREFSLPMDWNWLFQKQTDAEFSSKLPVSYIGKATSDKNRIRNWEMKTIDQFVKMAYCLSWFIELPEQPEVPGFNGPKMFLLSMLRTFGIPQDRAEDVAKDFAERFSDRHRSNPVKRGERRGDAASAAKTIFSSTEARYDFGIPGNCTTYLPSSIGRKKAVSEYCGGCPRFNPNYTPTEYYRLRLDRLLKYKISGDAIKTYLELAILGPASSKSDLEQRTGLSPHKLTNALDELTHRDFVTIKKKGLEKIIAAKRPVQKSIGSKI